MKCWSSHFKTSHTEYSKTKRGECFSTPFSSWVVISAQAPCVKSAWGFGDQKRHRGINGDIFSQEYLYFRDQVLLAPQKRIDVNEGNLNSAGKRGMFIKRNRGYSLLPDPTVRVLQVLVGDALSAPDNFPFPSCSSQ